MEVTVSQAKACLVALILSCHLDAMLDENDVLKTELKHSGAELPLVPRIEEVGQTEKGNGLLLPTATAPGPPHPTPSPSGPRPEACRE
jgi:hypothetical protein